MSTQGHETEQKKYPYRTIAQCRPWYLVIYHIAWWDERIFRMVRRSFAPGIAPRRIPPSHASA